MTTAQKAAPKAKAKSTPKSDLQVALSQLPEEVRIALEVMKQTRTVRNVGVAEEKAKNCYSRTDV